MSREKKTWGPEKFGIKKTEHESEGNPKRIAENKIKVRVTSPQ